ncbi:MAG: hypothetical protein EPN20_18785 [Magnetospirillum sp.]|nr:MAG: hypothetical protein EPN20_18785 [Magnetospirillum sp.]
MVAVILTGVAGGAMLHAHFFIGLAAIPLPVLYIALRRQAGYEDLASALGRQFLAALGGAVGLTLVFGLISFGQGGEFWFIQDSFNYIDAVGVFGESAFTSAFDQWFPYATYLILPTAAALAGSLRLLRAPPTGSARILVINLLGVGGAFLAVHLLTGHHVLQYWNYGSFLLPPAILALIALLYSEEGKFHPIILAGLAVLAVAGLGLPIAGREFLSIGRLVTPTPLTLPLTLVACGLALVTVFLTAGRGRRWPSVVVLVLIAVSTAAPRPERPAFLADLHRFTVSGMAEMRDMVASGTAGYWYDEAESGAEMLRWLPASGAWRVPFVANSLSQLVQKLPAFRDAGQMVVASHVASAPDSVIAALAAQGIAAVVADRRVVDVGTGPVTFTLLQRPVFPANAIRLVLTVATGRLTVTPEPVGSESSLIASTLWDPQGGAAVAADGGLDVVTGREPSSYAALLKQPIIAAIDGTYYLSADLRIKHGGAAIGFLDEKGSRWLATATAPFPAGRSGVVVVRVEAHQGDRLMLMISNAYPSGSGSSRFIVTAINLAVAPRGDANGHGGGRQ